MHLKLENFNDFGYLKDLRYLISNGVFQHATKFGVATLSTEYII